MKFERAVKATFFFLCLVSFLTLATPLAFDNIWIRNLVFLLVTVFAFFVARDIENRFLKNVLRWSPLLVFSFFGIISFISFTNPLTGGWKTVWISHRVKNQPRIYIAGQMLDIGARGYADKIVKVIPITPGLNWVTPVDTTDLSEDWMRVNEDFNPFNWKN